MVFTYIIFFSHVDVVDVICEQTFAPKSLLASSN